MSDSDAINPTFKSEFSVLVLKKYEKRMEKTTAFGVLCRPDHIQNWKMTWHMKTSTSEFSHLHVWFQQNDLVFGNENRRKVELFIFFPFSGC